MGSIPPYYSNVPYDNPHSQRYTNSNSNEASRSAGSSTRAFVDSAMDSEHPTMPSMGDPSFDILEWHPAFLSCQRYFLDHAQYEPGTQAVCALINIRLPFQWLSTPLTSSTPSAPPNSGGSSFNFNPYAQSGGRGGQSPHSRNAQNQQNFVSPVPYIRRLIVTGFDKAPILHGFFGDDYVRGIMPHVECERRNYLFAAKHGGWRSCKKQYDTGSGHGGDESVPFMKPLDEAKVQELEAAEQSWSEWLAMEDWMVGPRAPSEERPPQARGGGAHTSAGRREMREGLADGIPDGYRSR